MSYITILGIDPGIHNCGIAYNKYDPKTGVMTVADYFTIHAAELAKKKTSVYLKITEQCSLYSY